MPPPVLDEDFEGLDEVVDEMSKTSVPATSSKKSASTAQSVAGGDDNGKQSASDMFNTGADEFPDPEDDALDEELAREFEEQMQGFLKNLDGSEADMLAKLMQDFAPVGDAAAGSAATTSQQGQAAADANTKQKGPQKPANFQSSVASTLEKMRQSEQSAGSATNADDPAALLSSLLGGLGGDLPEGDEESLQAMLDQMMSQLMSKDLLYEPLKDMRDKYPAYLAENKSQLTKEDHDRYEQQRTIIDRIVTLFEDETTPEDVRNAKVADLVKEMNDCGSPPKELMGDMPEGLDLGPDGMPKMLNECPTS